MQRKNKEKKKITLKAKMDHLIPINLWTSCHHPHHYYGLELLDHKVVYGISLPTNKAFTAEVQN